jgi:hypothetical protein
MAACVDSALWLQSRRIGETKGRIAALDDIRLRLIEMSDIAAAETLAGQLERLRKDLDYQQQVMVAMQARAVVGRPEQAGTADLRSMKLRSDRAALAAWSDGAPSELAPLRVKGAA